MLLQNLIGRISETVILKRFKEFCVVSQIGLEIWDRSSLRRLVDGLLSVTERYVIRLDLNGSVDPIPSVHGQAAPSAVAVLLHDTASSIGIKREIDPAWLAQAPTHDRITVARAPMCLPVPFFPERIRHPAPRRLRVSLDKGEIPIERGLMLCIGEFVRHWPDLYHKHPRDNSAVSA
jgi:hypothetical protein